MDVGGSVTGGVGVRVDVGEGAGDATDAGVGAGVGGDGDMGGGVGGELVGKYASGPCQTSAILLYHAEVVASWP